MAIVIAVVIVFLVIVIAMIRRYRRPPQLVRRLRSTPFSRRRSEALRHAAAADVTQILEADGYPSADKASDADSEL